MKTFYYFTMLFLFLEIPDSKSQTWQWAQSGGGINFDGSGPVAIDHSGNVYMGGSFYDTSYIGNDTLIGVSDLFISKYNSAGVLQWIKTAGGPAGEAVNGIGCDSSGNVYVSGTFGEDFNGNTGFTCTFETTTLTAVGQADFFLAKYDPSGTLLWILQEGGNGSENGSGMKVDAAGNCYVTGSYGFDYFGMNSGYGAIFGPYALTSNGYENCFVAKYNNNGDLQWVNQSDAIGYVRVLSLCTDTMGHAYVTGIVWEYNYFGTTLLPGNSVYYGPAMFIARCDSSGWVWAHGGISTEDVVGSDLVADNAGHVFATGSFTGQADFDAFSYTTVNSDAYYSCYNAATGNLQWINHSAGTDQVSGEKMAMDSTNHIHIAGSFSGTANFGIHSVLSNGNSDVFIAVCDTLGQIDSVYGFGGNGYDGLIDMEFDGTGNFYITGTFEDTISIGTNQLISHGNDDFFVAKFGNSITTGIPFLQEGKIQANVFPNPISANATIEWIQIKNEKLRIDIIDIAGNKVCTLLNKEIQPGNHHLEWDGKNTIGNYVNAGTYLITISTTNQSQSKRVLVIR